jgi:glycerophosphoryl diester phosphodiesterase
LNPRAPAVLALILRDLRHTWQTLMLTGVFYRILGVAIFTPLVGLVMWIFLATSGRTVVADEDLLLVLLHPFGLAALVVIGGGMLAIIAMEQACLMTIAFGSVHYLAVSVRQALRYAFVRAWRVLSLATRIVVRVMLIAAPFLAAGAAIFAVLLTKLDINFYLSQRPPAFWAAAVLLGIVLAGLAVTIAVMLARWAFALPLVLFEDVEPARALRVSADRTQGDRWRIAVWIIGWAMASLVLSTIATGFVSLVGRLVTSLVTGSLPWLLLMIGSLLALFVLLHLTVSLVQATTFSLIVVQLFEHYGKMREARRAWVGTFTRQGEHVPTGISARALRWGSFAALAIAIGVAGVLLHEAELEDQTEITAHRGASGAAPENTLAAVKRAIEDGAHWVEIDVQRTADNEVVVIHDRDLKRVGGVNLRVASTTYAELSAINVGGWFGSEFRSERLPTLDQVLALCKGRTKVNIELKYYGTDARLAERVVEIVEAHEMANEIVVMSLKYDAVRQMKALRPDWSTGLLTAVAVGNLTGVDADFFAVNANLATRRFVRQAHLSGKQVHAWTVNDVVGMTALISRGVDNLITDEPALALAVLRHRARLSPSERLLVKVALIVGVRPQPIDPSNG